ncbi:MAG: hypothetical protein Q8O40_09045, partial [Chloroflexota bacterium]|nr:hypothetical protein [Chloroflexota bacterium]
MPNQTPAERPSPPSPPIVVRVEQGQQGPTEIMGSLIPILGLVMLMAVSSIGGIFGGPKKGFKDLLATYWSETVGVGRLNEPGAKLDIVDGSRFGAHVSFKHLD